MGLVLTLAWKVRLPVQQSKRNTQLGPTREDLRPSEWSRQHLPSPSGLSTKVRLLTYQREASEETSFGGQEGGKPNLQRLKGGVRCLLVLEECDQASSPSLFPLSPKVLCHQWLLQVHVQVLGLGKTS